jgi:hypothetical protein
VLLRAGAGDEAAEREHAVGGDERQVAVAQHGHFAAHVTERAVGRRAARQVPLVGAEHRVGHRAARARHTQVGDLVGAQAEVGRRGRRGRPRLASSAGRRELLGGVEEAARPRARAVEGRRAHGEDRRGRPRGRVALGGQLHVGLGDAEAERRDHVLRCHRAHLVERRLDGGGRREEQVRGDRQGERDERPHAVQAHLRAPLVPGVARLRLAPQSHEVSPPRRPRTHG